MQELSTEQLVESFKNGARTLTYVAVLHVIRFLGTLGLAARAEALGDAWLVLAHYALLAVGFFLLGRAALKGGKLPVRLGAIALLVIIIGVVYDSMISEELGRNILFLVIRGVFLFMLNSALYAHKQLTIREPGHIMLHEQEGNSRMAFLWLTWGGAGLILAGLIGPLITLVTSGTFPS